MREPAEGLVTERRARRDAATTLAAHGWRIRSLRPIRVEGQAPLHPAYRATTADERVVFVKVRYGAGGLSVEQYSALRASGIPMPRMLARYPASGAHCEVYEFVAASNALELWPRLPKSMRTLVARYLAAFAATLADFGRTSSPAGIPRVNIVAEIAGTAGDLAHLLGPRHALWNLLDRLPATSPVPVLCHGDLNAKNLLITAAGTVMLVDWEWAAVAEPAYEMKNVRAIAARGFGELASTLDAYEAMSGIAIPEERLLLADISYALIQLRLAAERGWSDWQGLHKRRIARLIRRYRDVA